MFPPILNMKFVMSATTPLRSFPTTVTSIRVFVITIASCPSLFLGDKPSTVNRKQTFKFITMKEKTSYLTIISCDFRVFSGNKASQDGIIGSKA